MLLLGGRESRMTVRSSPTNRKQKEKLRERQIPPHLAKTWNE
jgi:hypothetical protein